MPGVKLECNSMKELTLQVRDKADETYKNVELSTDRDRNVELPL